MQNGSANGGESVQKKSIQLTPADYYYRKKKWLARRDTLEENSLERLTLESTIGSSTLRKQTINFDSQFVSFTQAGHVVRKHSNDDLPTHNAQEIRKLTLLDGNIFEGRRGSIFPPEIITPKPKPKKKSYFFFLIIYFNNQKSFFEIEFYYLNHFLDFGNILL